MKDKKRGADFAYRSVSFVKKRFYITFSIYSARIMIDVDKYASMKRNVARSICIREDNSLIVRERSASR